MIVFAIVIIPVTDNFRAAIKSEVEGAISTGSLYIRKQAGIQMPRWPYPAGGGYGRLCLVPGFPRTRNNGGPLCIFIKDNKNIKEKKIVDLWSFDGTCKSSNADQYSDYILVHTVNANL
jgi:hypothetical protein